MDSIYTWLLQNMGNEGNYLTILNTQPYRKDEHIVSLDVMARTKSFEIVNLSIQSNISLKEVEQRKREIVEKEYQFADSNQVITYLSDGQEPNTLGDDKEPALYVYLVKPPNDSGGITFPLQQ